MGHAKFKALSIMGLIKLAITIWKLFIIKKISWRWGTTWMVSFVRQHPRAHGVMFNCWGRDPIPRGMLFVHSGETFKYNTLSHKCIIYYLISIHVRLDIHPHSHKYTISHNMFKKYFSYSPSSPKPKNRKGLLTKKNKKKN